MDFLSSSVCYGRPAQQMRTLYFCPVVSSPYVIGQTIIFLPCDFYLSSSSFFLSSPNLSGRRLALVRIYDASLKPAARGSLEMQDAKSRQKSPSGHHRTTLSGYIFATKACIDSRKKKLVKQRYVLHTSPQCGELRPTNG